jgi:hypothetical protein
MDDVLNRVSAIFRVTKHTSDGGESFSRFMIIIAHNSLFATC